MFTTVGCVGTGRVSGAAAGAGAPPAELQSVLRERERRAMNMSGSAGPPLGPQLPPQPEGRQE